MGHKNKDKHIWVICPICKRGHWVKFIVKKNKPINIKCLHCTAIENINKFPQRGEKHFNWKGIKRKTNNGYILNYIGENNNYGKYKTPYIYEHRLIMSEFLKRPLKKWEIVHHINGIKDDNRIENLELINNSKHLTITTLTENIKKLEEENKILKEEIKILERELNEYKN